MEEQETSFNTSTSNNAGYNMASALQIRLDSKSIIEDIEIFLRGVKTIITQDTSGNLKKTVVKYGKAKANDLGIQAVINYISAIINPQVVQGNFPSEAP